MTAITEERALIAECYSHMQEIGTLFNRMVGSEGSKLDPATLTNDEMLREMRDALAAVRERIGPAMQNPMIQMMLKRMT